MSSTTKAITCPVILSGVRTRVDGSLGLAFATPELAPESKLVFLELQNKQLTMLLQPSEETTEAMHEVKKQFQTKTPGMRLRAVLFVAWRQAGEPGEFDTFYTHKMENIIEGVKRELQPM